MFGFSGPSDLPDDAEAWAEIQRNQEARRPGRRSQVTQAGVQPMMGMGDHMRFANQAAAPHFGAQNAMMAQVNDAIQRENDSRVAQEREARRMEHERQMKQMEIDSLLARLQQSQQAPVRQGRVPIASGRNFAIYSD